MFSTETLERPMKDEAQQAAEIIITDEDVLVQTTDILEPPPGDFIIRYSSKFGHIALGPRQHIRRYTL